MYLDLNSASYTAEINNIAYTLRRGDNIFTYNTLTDVAVTTQWNDLQLSVSKNSTKKCLYLNCASGIPNDDTIYTYTIEGIVRFTSGKTITATANVIIMQNPVIVMATQSSLYNAINTRWTAKYGSGLSRTSIYRSDLLTLDGTLMFDSNTTNIHTVNESSLFNYLPSIEGLVFQGCS